jgi:hypothetical protein
MTALLRRLGDILLGILNEITDQSAYQRHLASRGVPHSGTEWRKFCDHRWQDKEKRGRCC